MGMQSHMINWWICSKKDSSHNPHQPIWQTFLMRTIHNL